MSCFKALRVRSVSLALSATGLLILAIANPVQGAPQTTFPRAYFNNAQPTTALDMIKLLPGFQLHQGDSDVRGYSGSVGNVLIDGQRPASKEDSLDDVLKRISANAVDHIELVRSAEAGFDMQGFAILANIVRKDAKSIRGRLEVENAAYRQGLSAPKASIYLSYDTGGGTIELSAEAYRDIDDDSGIGSREQYAAHGAPGRIAAYAQKEWEDVRHISTAYQQGILGGTFNARAFFQQSREFSDVEERARFPAPSKYVETERGRGGATEVQTDYQKGIFGGSFETLGIYRTEDDDATSRARDESSVAVARKISKTSETTLRALFRKSFGFLTLQGGAEGVINVLDNIYALELDGFAVKLPAENVRIEERRAEYFADATMRLSDVFAVESSLRYEASDLIQTGDSNLAKPLSFLKPRLLVRWAANEQSEFRLSAEREVGQLDFDDFVSSASFVNDNVTAGNRDLEPEDVWRLELEWEHHFWEKASLVLSARHEIISNVVDHIAVFSGNDIYDSIGNIGGGVSDEIKANLELPLDAIGLTGLTVRASASVNHSQVTDPITKRRRTISDDKPVDGELNISYDLPEHHLRLGGSYEIASKRRHFKIDEIESEISPNELGVFAEFTPVSNWTFRLFGKSLLREPSSRDRTIYSGLRDVGAIRYAERRIVNSGAYFGINIQHTFGN